MPVAPSPAASVIAVISQKGRAGKTTLALHLAAAAYEAGRVALVFYCDRQATASQWAAWRQDAPPEIIDSPPPRIAAKVATARDQGANFIVIDTPLHAACAAMEIADLVLIPCPPSAFDLSAVQTTAKLVQLLRKSAFVAFTASSPNATRLYEEAAGLVEGYGTPACTVQIPDRAAFCHASAEGRTVMETEPASRTAEDVRLSYGWTCRQTGMNRLRKGRARESYVELRQPAHAGAGVSRRARLG